MKNVTANYRSYHKLSANVAGFIMPLHRCIPSIALLGSSFIGQPKQWQSSRLLK